MPYQPATPVSGHAAAFGHTPDALWPDSSANACTPAAPSMRHSSCGAASSFTCDAYVSTFSSDFTPG